LADIKPIAHLYKTQVYELARFLGVPHAIIERPPTTDTYSLEQSQEEFYWSLPVRTLDRVLWARNAGHEAASAAAELGLEPQQVERAYRDIDRKRSTTLYLHLPALLVEPVTPVSPAIKAALD
jgi:NAD+ synthase